MMMARNNPSGTRSSACGRKGPGVPWLTGAGSAGACDGACNAGQRVGFDPNHQWGWGY